MDNIFLGVLSGTSLDAINVGAFTFAATQAKLHHAVSYAIPEQIKNSCLQLMETSTCNLEQLGTLDHKLGVLFADAILNFLREYNIDHTFIAAIGCHGQTINHKPNIQHPFTLQIGDPNIIAAKTGLTIIADFRRKDLAVGGQGAPLAPAFHAAMFRSAQITRTIVNIGGISNISVLDKDLTQPVIGFDTGPGNCLLDGWVQKHFNLKYDDGGKIAQQGKIIDELLTHLLTDAYFQTAAPKSTGREYFNLTWLDKYLQQLPANSSPQDILATLVQLTSTTISNAILASSIQPEVYICGGGAYNQALMLALQKNLNYKIYTTEILGIAPEWVETGLFAWLARQRLLQQPGNLSSVTGANKAVVLGGMYYGH